MPGNATKSHKSYVKDREEKAVRDNIADRLDDLIKDRKITSDTVAKETGIAKGTISNYLNAKTSPKALELKKLADFFGVPIDHLIYKNGSKSLDIDLRSIHEITGLSDEAIEVLKSHNEIDEGWRKDLEGSLMFSMDTVNRIIENTDILKAITSYFFFAPVDFVNVEPIVVDNGENHIKYDFPPETYENALLIGIQNVLKEEKYHGQHNKD